MLALDDALCSNIKDEALPLRYLISRLNIRIFGLKKFSQTRKRTLKIKAMLLLIF